MVAKTVNIFGGFFSKILFHSSSVAYLRSKTEERIWEINKNQYFFVYILGDQSQTLKNLAV